MVERVEGATELIKGRNPWGDLGSYISLRTVYGKTLLKLGKEDHKIVVLDADLSASTKTNLFARQFPERFFNVGIAEQDMMGTAAGLALAGFKPFVSTFAVFATSRAYDQVRQSIAYPELPVRIVVTHGGITVGEDGPTHHAIEDIALMRALPHMKVIVPADPWEVQQVIETIARDDEGPVYVRLPRPNTEIILSEKYKFEIGKSYILVEGEDIVIFSTGIMTIEALKAVEMLQQDGIYPQLVHVPTLKPLDPEIFKLAGRARLVVTVEEHSLMGGFGAAVSTHMSEHDPKRVLLIGIPDIFTESAPYKDLLRKYGLDSVGIYRRIKEFLSKWADSMSL